LKEGNEGKEKIFQKVPLRATQSNEPIFRKTRAAKEEFLITPRGARSEKYGSISNSQDHQEWIEMRLTKQLWILNWEIKNKRLKGNRRKRNAFFNWTKSSRN
jgi:hypothetical protein